MIDSAYYSIVKKGDIKSMSAGICIMNKNAIALAADSAVTIGDHVAIHNSANKLFSLSRVAPVGVIVYADATLMTVPIEIIIKQYKKQLGDRVFKYLKDYVCDFLKYVEENIQYFRFDINEQHYVFSVFMDLMCGLLGDYNRLLEERKRIGIDVNDETVLNDIAELAVRQTIEFVDSIPKQKEYDFCNFIEEKYFNMFSDTIKKDDNLTWLTEEQIIKISKKTCELFNTNFDRSGYVGVSIAGYGEEEIYPHLIHLHISGVINGKLKYYFVESVEISEKTPASIVPFAQTDVMQTFLFGINDEFINDLAQEIPNQLNSYFNLIDKSCFATDRKNIVQSEMKVVTDNIINHMKEVAGRNYMLPIIQSVASLPIEELALLAESMINITSLRRKVAIDRNIGTVGGPIDVSIISKGDGFIWLKRKHYFDRQYNPQYFYSHFEKLNEGKDLVNES